ncbi:LodA/GoxA family CTQ-dependent oxidase [Streptomyces sp. NPDC015184]|uniref:LodA/GoxA family CTQ-dependent oxidase n=1 Tax=Streptomyces sp. NPDC015184 TaxID=3364946 RepID=UPI0036F61D2F
MAVTSASSSSGPFENDNHADGIPVAEPDPAQPPSTEPLGRDTWIVRAAIHPAIGVARVGDSADGFFLAPETDDEPPLPTGSYKDATGALKRQAARFRIYGYNAAGEPVAELTAANAEVRWTVHVANKKADWYQFQLALDIPEADQAAESQLRNPLVAGADRHRLVIDPGPRSVQGPDHSGGPELRFDTGKFLRIPVYLGELRTDGAGRLIFIGGRGVSESVDFKEAEDFANNDGWYDDVSDGPVTAEVRVDGRELHVEPAWVVVGPPNYAPELKSVRTLYDLLRDTFTTAGMLPEPEQVSFTYDILPILRRLCDLQWVNQGLATLFGHGGREHFLAPDLLAALADPSARHEELRRQISKAMRDPDRDGTSPIPWPPVYGDAMSLPAVSARQHLALSQLQTRLLERWTRGDFVPDHVPGPGATPTELDQLPLAVRPAALDRAALSFCLADAFHPGCEITWPMRHTTLYSAPFRIRLRSSQERSYGKVLTPKTALLYDGPLYAQRPGGLTRWMAVPWQTDTASCRSGYERRYDPYLPTFWPARVPNHVLTEEDYLIAVDTTRPREERLAAFYRRASWDRWLPSPYKATINAMVKDFGRLGLVERHPGVTDDPLLPAEMLVESEVSFPAEPAPPRGRNLLSLHVPLAADERLRDAVLATAVALAEEPDEELSAGYIAKVARFPGNR